MPDFFLRYLTVSLSGADQTYVEEEVDIPAAVAKELAMTIYKIEFTEPAGLMGVDAHYCRAHLALKSKAAWADIDDEDVLWADASVIDIAGAAYEVVRDRKHTADFYPPLLVTKSKLYVGCEIETAAAWTAALRIWYVPKTISTEVLLANLLDELE